MDEEDKLEQLDSSNDQEEQLFLRQANLLKDQDYLESNSRVNRVANFTFRADDPCTSK